jgi:hypothetical protein
VGVLPVIASSLGSAAAFALATTLKHRSAGVVPDAQDLDLRRLGRLVRATVSHRLWLAGIAADVVAVTLQVVALHLGGLAVVQPLLVSGLLFALLLRQGTAGRVNHQEVAWGLVLTAALAGFLVLAGTSTPASGPPEPPDRTPAVAAALTGVVFAAICVALGRRMRGHGSAAAALGVAVGLVYAGTAALIKALTDIGVGHPVAVLSSWQLYALIGAGATGLTLNQLAFQAGPLTASLPATATVDPLASIALGVLVYDEHLRPGATAALGLTALLMVLGTATVQLSRAGATGQGRLPAGAGQAADSRGRNRGDAAGPFSR